MMNQVSKYFTYAPRFSFSPPKTSSDRNFQADLNSLNTNGTLVLENFISPEMVGFAQEKINSRFQSKFDFEVPCLAQKKVNPDLHKEIIEKKFKYSNAYLDKQGLCFSKKEIIDYDQLINDLKPSTLKMYLENDIQDYNLFLAPYLMNLIEGYMGMIPYMTEAYIRRNFPSDFRVMNHNWHRDQNHKDYLLKAFYFFTDCDIQHGPHEFILGSHKDLTISGKDYFEDSEIDKVYPPQSAKRYVSKVKAGTVILEDTRGLHRASVPKVGYRDLGYAIFVPTPFWRPHREPFYKISQSVYSSLSGHQKKYIPRCSII